MAIKQGTGVVGVVRFSQTPGTSGTVVDGTIDGLAPGTEHALAIHESGDLSEGCASTGGHFNPRGVRHGSPKDEVRHVGDLGNVRADSNGRASFKFVDRMVAVNDIIGRSVVVAEGPDDFGIGDSPLSKVGSTFYFGHFKSISHLDFGICVKVCLNDV